MSDNFIIDPQRGPHIRDYSDLSQDRVVVCSPTGWWTAVGWWKAKGRGFTSLQMAGVFTRDEAYKMSRRRKQEFGTCFHSVPADHVPTLQAEVERFKEALTQISQWCGVPNGECPASDCPSRVASAALAAQPSTRKDQQ